MAESNSEAEASNLDPGKVEEGLPSVPPDIVEAEYGDTVDNIVPTHGYELQPLVGLGASAGGITALQTFFADMPADSGMAFVVVVHLAPEHTSVLDSILRNVTTMRVVQAADDQEIEANHVYVIPPGKFLTVNRNRLRLDPLEPERGKRVAVDLFFRTLADSHGPHSAAVVLSGADGDGAIGLRRVKERGGLTIAQEPGEAEHKGMPQSAIDTGMVDWVLPVEEIPRRLVDYFENEWQQRLPPEQAPEPAKNEASPNQEDEAAMKEILSYLRIRTSRDFTCYKRATIVRRIARRMQVNGMIRMPGYLSYLRTHPGEVGALQQDLLISVTNFFRDREAFAALEARIPQLFAGKGAGDCVRVWVAACATGEEAFSVGILLLEYAGTLDDPPAVQIFATDLAEEVIVSAREGMYPHPILADVSEERIRRFFTKEPRGFRVRRELRECVLFAVHDVLRDAPFSRLDLISCRNLLIYLNPAAQKRVMDIFHFALLPKGQLFLGSSESVEEGTVQWSIVDKKHRLFGKNAAARPSLPIALGPDTLARAVDAQDRSKGGPVLHGSAFAARAVLAVQRSLAGTSMPDISWEELHFRLIERFSAPSIVVTRDYDIVHVSQNAGRLLHFSSGEPSVNLLQVVDAMLRVELRATLFRAAQSNAKAEAFNVPVELDNRLMAVDIKVCPAEDIAPDYLLVVFDVRDSSETEPRPAPAEEPVVRHLERENESLKRRLRDVIEQYEASGEELKAGNEELQAMNEELRSAAEELETSKEELQSINEELTTVNQELKCKVDELGKVNSDFANLMAATGVATVFLDRNLKITRYTPVAVQIFNLIPSDIGRPLNHITHQLEYPSLLEDAKRVLASLIPVQREVTDGKGWFLAHILPYRTTEEHIVGVVLSFVDMTESRIAQEALRLSEERFRLVLENVREYAIISLDLNRRVMMWNSGAQGLLGYTENEILGESADLIFTPEDREAGAPQKEATIALRDGRATDERWHIRKDGSRFWGSGAMMSMHGPNGEQIGLVKVFCDHTEKRRAQEALENSRVQLHRALHENEDARRAAEAATRAKDQFMAMLSHELRTPLTPMTMGLYLLEERTDLPADVIEILDMIRGNLQMEKRFIDELLDMSRIIHGKLEVERHDVNLHKIVKAAVSVSQQDFTDKKQTLDVKLEAKDTAILGDSDRLQQVLWNLLKNASKFTPEGGRILLSTGNEKGCIFVQIKDSGMGFAKGDAEHIFDAFHQAEATGTTRKKSSSGLGLGLAIAKAAVEEHRGNIRAESKGEGKGATFTVRLPLASSGDSDLRESA